MKNTTAFYNSALVIKSGCLPNNTELCHPLTKQPNVFSPSKLIQFSVLCTVLTWSDCAPPTQGHQASLGTCFSGRPAPSIIKLSEHHGIELCALKTREKCDNLHQLLANIKITYYAFPSLFPRVPHLGCAPLINNVTTQANKPCAPTFCTTERSPQSVMWGCSFVFRLPVI